ncbi:MAG: hypothetical protein EF813_08780 [Methanosarcinales archaeon]|nr:MAG: hypothetical protein EF813_08780 [Methanosarcinales archaeon]
MRLSGNKKNGGPEGHVSRTLEPVEEPDHIEVRVADRCILCGATLEGACVDDCPRAPPGSLTFRP